ncbi:MAG: ABC transporter substrate-binding protein [Hungatella sp.]|jgi:iron complex transport system substrate-binding protein|nr:ABC transporter substrate-binding protein [Hungatella sp.]
MKKNNVLKLTTIMAAAVLMMTACSSPSTTKTTETTAAETTAAVKSGEALTVEIKDVHGLVTVPVNPQKVISLDNRTYETLSDWGIKLVAAPKGVMPAGSSYVADESVLDIGNHREPNLEIIAAADPDLVIVGQRFASYYEEIKKLVPNAVVIDLNFDVSEEADTPGENLVNGLKDSTVALGKIFDKNKEAEQLTADFDQAIESVKSAYNGTDSIMSVVVSGGNIGFSAPHSGRVWGPMYEVFGWVPALDIDNTTSDHQGDDISVEAIAQSNPDWIFVLDRDAAVSSAADAVPAQDVIDQSPALQNVTAVSEGHIVYAPADTYTNESIQTYLELFGDLAKALAE